LLLFFFGEVHNLFAIIFNVWGNLN
jgi:hypothetical protein